MNITDCLYRAAHNYEHGGLEALALRMGISASSLAHKVKPSNTLAHCSPGEVAQICELTGDHSALQALAQRLGYVLLPVPQLADGVDASVAHEIAQTAREFGEFISEAGAGLADGHVTANELRRIEREASEMIAAAQRLCALASRVHEQGNRHTSAARR